MAVPALLVEKVVKTYADPAGGRLPVLDVPHLEVAPGEHLLLQGESGSGKTTLLNAIAGIVRVQEGHIAIGGEAMTGRSERARDALRARRIGYLFQTFNLLPALTAYENVLLGLTFRGVRGAKARKQAGAALDRVGLGSRQRHKPAQLSVGQQQRVAIARALVGHPTLVLADEPTSSLDAARAKDCMDLLDEFCREREAALLVVTHDDRLKSRYENHQVLRAPVLAETAP